MHGDGLSLDGFLSAAFGGIVFLILALDVIHHYDFLRDRFPNQRWLGRFLDFCARRRTWTLSMIIGAYRLRYVSLFVLLAIVVSVVAPVSSLMEIEESIVSRACGNLIAGNVMPGVDPARCATLAIKNGVSYVNLDFGDTRDHLLQVALWPLTIMMYGFLVSGHFWLTRKSPDQPLEEVVEMFPHVHHFFSGLLAFVLVGISGLQNAIGG